MSTFGDYETFGEPLAVTNVQGHVTTVWRARKAGAQGEAEFAIKCYAPRRPAKDSGDQKPLDRDRGLEFLEGIKQIKKVHGGNARHLTPIHDLGISPDGAWYATDCYSRGSLMTLIGRRAKVDGGGVRQIVRSIVAGCLALKRSRGVSHGNLKAANVFLAGKPRPLLKTQMVLADAYPAAPLQLARLEAEDRHVVDNLLNQVAEVQDLRAIGEIILQLVERRQVSTAYDYNYPVARSDAWDSLGKEAEYWRGLCNQLLDPQLSLSNISLDTLAKKFPAPASGNKLMIVVPALLAVCLIGGGGYGYVTWNAKRHQENCREAVAAGQQALQAGNFDEAKRNSEAALKWEPNDAAALGLGKSIEDAVDKQYALLMTSAGGKYRAGRWNEALDDVNEADRLKPGGADAKSLRDNIGAAQRAAASRQTREQQYQTALTEAQTRLAAGDYSGAMARAEAALAVKPGDAAATQLREQARRQWDATSVLQRQQKSYTDAMQNARSLQSAGDYAGALTQVNEALKVKPKDRDALQLGEEIRRNRDAAAANQQLENSYATAMQSGRSLLAGGDFAGAIAQADAALKVKPDDAAALQLKQDARTRLESAQNAVRQQKAYETALQAGQAAFDRHDYSTAVTQADAALQAKPNDATAAQLKQNAQGQLSAEQAAAQRRKTYDTAMQAGQAAYNRHDYPAAVTQAEAALQISPDDAAAAKLKQDAQEQLRAEQVAAQKQKAYDTALQAGQAAYKRHDYATAVTQADAALQVMPNDAAAAQLKQNAQGQLEAEQAVAQRQKAYDTAMKDGQAAFDRHDYSTAVTQADAALQAKPNDAPAAQLKQNAQTQLEAAQAAAANQKAYDMAMSDGQAAYNRGDYSTAAAQAGTALKYKPNDAAATKLSQDAATKKSQLDALDTELEKLCIELGESKPKWLDMPGAKGDSKYTTEMDFPTLDYYSNRIKVLEQKYQAGGWLNQNNRARYISNLKSNLRNRGG